MKLLAGSLALALTLALVAGAEAREKKKTTQPPPDNSQCLADCQVGFTKCNVSGLDRNGHTASPAKCQKELAECQQIFCAVNTN